MTFRQFVTNNVLRNKRLYAAYFLSSMFTVMVFFTFAIFAFHPAFYDSGINGEVLYGMAVAGGVIYLFSFFFVLYSMGSFLQSRKKEFGLLTMHGMSLRQIRLMVFMENMLIGFFATVIGIGIGILFAKFILLIGENVLIIEESLYFYIPIWPVIITFGSFMALFFIISFSVTFVLRSKKIIELIKGNKQPKEEPKGSIVLTIIAILLLAVGYYVALIARGLEVVMAMVPVIVVVMIGTYFLFTQVSVFFIRFMKQRKSFFWKKTNMIVLSDLSFRMKDNARTFFMVAMISTVAFSAIGSLFGFQAYLTSGMKETFPYSFTYVEYDETEADKLEEHVKRMDELLEEHNVQTDREDVTLHYFKSSTGEDVLMTNESTYNTVAHLIGERPLDFGDDELIAVEASPVMIEEYRESEINMNPAELQNGTRPTAKRTIESNVLPEINVHYVMSDSLYEQLSAPVESDRYVLWNATSGTNEDVIAVGERASEEIGHQLQAIDYMEYSINKFYGPVLFIGLFIGLVFFVSAGSFLYFRLYSDVDEDKEKFASIAKMGLTNRELKKVITRQTAILFFTPMIVALIHGAVALTALSHMFNYNLTKQSMIVLGSFLLIQIGYYLVVRYVYTKQIKAAL